MHRLPPSEAHPAGGRVVGPLTPLQQQLLLAGGGADGFEAFAAPTETAESLGLQGLLPDEMHGSGGGSGSMALQGSTEGGTLIARLSGEVDSDDDAEARAVLREREEMEDGDGGAEPTDALVDALLAVRCR